MKGRVIKTAYQAVKKRSPQILTALGIAEFIAAIGFTANATPKAMVLKAEMEKEKQENGEVPTKLDVVKACWKPYIRTGVAAAMGTASLIASNVIMNKRNAAWAAAYTAAITAAKEYRDTVTEVVGEEKQNEILKRADEKKLEKNPMSRNDLYLAKHSGDLCYDPYSGRYFISTQLELEGIRNDLNHEMLTIGAGYDHVYLNDFYDAIGLDRTKIGDEYGWDLNNTGLIDLRLTTQMADNGRPCLVIGFSTEPIYGI